MFGLYVIIGVDRLQVVFESDYSSLGSYIVTAKL
jgi:hypothetical protein